MLKIWCSCFQDSLACIISPYGWAGNTLKMLPAHTSHLGFETTVTFAEEKRYVCLFMSKLRKKFACILITVTLQNLCKWHWSECLRWGGRWRSSGCLNCPVTLQKARVFFLQTPRSRDFNSPPRNQQTMKGPGPRHVPGKEKLVRAVFWKGAWAKSSRQLCWELKSQSLESEGQGLCTTSFSY